MTREQRHNIDTMLRTLPPFGTTIAELRGGFANFMAQWPGPTDTTVSETELGGIRTLLVEPAGGARGGTILYIHGGSYMLGSPETQLGLTAELVTRTGYRAYSIDYRLAPEHPFPAGVDDSVAAYGALLDSGVDPSTVAIAGDSAGGGLTVTTLIMAKRLGLPMPAAVFVMSPGVDLTRSAASMITKDGIDPMLTRAQLLGSTPLYVGDADPNQELLSAATLVDAAGFPPMLIQVGTNEILLDDSTRLAERARDAGVDVILDVTADVPHVFQMFAGSLDEADRALERAAFFLRQHLG